MPRRWFAARSIPSERRNVPVSVQERACKYSCQLSSVRYISGDDTHNAYFSPKQSQCEPSHHE